MKKILTCLIFISLLFENNFAQKEDILPVQLVYFEALVFSNGVILRWGTATEINNFGFEIQRADVPYQFVGIDFVPGHGNSNSPKHYMYVDTTLPNYGVYYYRLKQIDTDGTVHYSDTLTVNYFPASVENSNKLNFKKSFVHNNPSLNELTIYLSGNTYYDLTASIFSITGEKVYEINLFSQSNQIKINYKKLPAGVYIISLSSTSDFLLLQKFIIMR